MGSYVNVQDWEPVVFRKVDKKEASTASSSKAISQLPSKQLRDLMDNTGDSNTLKYVDGAFAKSVQKIRLAKKLTQVQLATMLNVPVQVVNELESGKLVDTNGRYRKLFQDKFVVPNKSFL